MALAIKRYKDGTYIPLFNPLVRRIDYGTPKKKVKAKRDVSGDKIKREYADAKRYHDAGLENPYGYKFSD